MAHQVHADLDEVRVVVKRYVPEDLEDLESLIFIGKKEQEIPQKRRMGISSFSRQIIQLWDRLFCEVATE